MYTITGPASVSPLSSEITYSPDAFYSTHPCCGNPVVWASTASWSASNASRVTVNKNVFAGPGTLCMDGSTCVSHAYTDTAVSISVPDRGTHSFVLTNGAITSLEIVGDAAPPMTTASYSGTPGNAGWWRSPVSVTLSAVDNPVPVNSDPGYASGVASTVLNGSPYLGPTTFSSEGANSLSYFSSDNWNNTEAAQSAVLNIDSIAPAVSHSLAGTAGLNGWYISPVTVTLTASDGTSGLSSTILDGSSYSSPVTISTQGSTSHSYLSADIAGNSSAAQAFNLQIDTAAPTTSITSHSNGQPAAGTISLGGTAADTASGVSAVDISFDGGGSWIPLSSSGVWSYNLDTTTFADGPLTVLVRATDLAGRVQPTSGAGSTSISLLVDNTLPTVSHSLSGVSGLGGWYVSEVVVTITANDGGSGVNAISLNGSSYTAPVTVSAQGTTNWPYFATDAAGNDSATGTVNFQLDSIAPATGISSHAEGDPVRGAVTVNGTVSDATSGVSAVEVSVNGGAWTAATLTSGTWSYAFDTTTMSDGPVTVGVRGADVAGNVQATSGAGATSISLLVDNTPPTVSHSLSGTLGLAGWYVSDVVVTVTANDSGSGVDSITLNSLGYTAPVTVGAQGATSWPYFATDAAANDSATGVAAFQLDTVRPTSTITSHTAGDFVSGTIVLSGVVSDATSGVSSLDVSTDSSTWTPANVNSGTWTYNLDTTAFSDGPIVVETRAHDVAGNLQPVSGAGATQVGLEVDNTPATGSLTAPGSFCPVCGDTIDLALDASDANGVANWVLSVDGFGPLASGAGAPGTIFTWDGAGVTPGNQVVRLTVTDVAGNVTEITVPVTVIYPGPPSAAIALNCPLPGDNGWCRAPVTVNLSGSVPYITILRLNYTYDGAGKTANGNAYAFAETVPGVTHTISLTATDSLGRTSGSVSDNFKVDGEVPVILFSGATASQFGLSVFDAHSGIVRWTAQIFEVSGQSVFWTERSGAFNGVLDWRPPQSGPYEIEIFARDGAGHEAGTGRIAFTIELPVIAQILNPVINLVVRPVTQPTAAPTVEPTSVPTLEPAPEAAPVTPTQPAAIAEAPPEEPVVESPALVTIGGIVFRDFNRDGQQNADEPGLPGVPVQIVIASDEVLTAITGPDGSFSIDLPKGKRYLLKILTPDGLLLTTPGTALVMEDTTREFISFGLGHTALAYWLLSLFGGFGLVWSAAAATDRRAAAVKSVASEMQQLARRNLALRALGKPDYDHDPSRPLYGR